MDVNYDFKASQLCQDMQSKKMDGLTWTAAVDYIQLFIMMFMITEPNSIPQ